MVPRRPLNPQAEHSFYELGSKRFEQFARALHEAQPDIVGTGLYGPDGQSQFGVDHYAFHRIEGGHYLEVGQSKAERRFGRTKVREAADKFLDHWDNHWREKDVRRFILFVGCSIKSREAADEIILQTDRFAKLGIQFSVWDSTAIFDRLHGANVVVRQYLDQDWYEFIFGKPAGPLSGLQQELEKGNWGALAVQGYVSRLNQAETAEIADFKRRTKKGESFQVIAELERALGSEAIKALSAAVRAEKLRLLAGLVMTSDDFARVQQLLDEADRLEGDSRRLRAILLLETVGSEAVLEGVDAEGAPELAEVRAVAWLRSNRSLEAFHELEPFLTTESVRAETIRLAALAKLVGGDRAAAVDLAERAVDLDGDSRACKQALAMCLFHRALSPAAEASVGEWPQPVDQPLVDVSDSGRADLERAESLFRSLMAGPELEGHRAMVMWHFAVLACMPWRHTETDARLAELQSDGSLPIPLIAWALSRALPLDRKAAVAQCNAALIANPQDLEALVICVALSNADRDFSTSRKLLQDHRPALDQAGHAELYEYWTAVLDLEMGKDAPSQQLKSHPWLSLRKAMDMRPKSARRKAIAAVLEEQLQNEGDARVILAATQLLLDVGWHKTAVKAARFLLEKIATAEAVATVAHAYYSGEQYAEALDVLQKTSVFPGGVLPVGLERLRANSLVASGKLIEAREASVLIARSTKEPADLWRTIQLQLATGAAPDALAIYEENAEVLSAPSPIHIALARAVMQSNPEAASRIARHITANAPDEFVTAAFDLASKLKLEAEQRVLTGRIQLLGAQERAGVSLVSLEDIPAIVKERRERLEQAFEKYANGHAPVYVLARFHPGGIAQAYLGPFLDAPDHSIRLASLSARYGRRWDNEEWPEDRTNVRLLVDLTALLTAHGLGLLDTVERAFRPLWIAPETIQALLQLESDIEIAQPGRVDAMRTLLGRLDARQIHDQGDLESQAGYSVQWQPAGKRLKSILSFPRLVEIALKGFSKSEARQARERLGNTLDLPAVGAHPKRGANLSLEQGIAVTLEEAGVFAALAGQFTVGIDRSEITEMRAAIADAERRQKLLHEISELVRRLREGLEDGSYKTVPPRDDPQHDHLVRSYMQLLHSLMTDGGIGWFDDRYSAAITGPRFNTSTTVEIVDALVRYGRLTEVQGHELRQRLLAARWLFMPLRGDQIAHFARVATKKGAVTETVDLAIMRRSIGEALTNRRRLQWPEPAAIEQGIHGEVPFLLDSGHAISGALVKIWNDTSWSIDDAEAASDWILDTLEIGLFPQQVLAAGDPRSDYLIGVHLGGLVLSAIQITKGKNQQRQQAYLDWLWRHVVAGTLRVRPEIRIGFEGMIEGQLTNTDSDVMDDQTWRALMGRLLNSTPPSLRVSLLQRQAIRVAFNLSEHGQVTVDRFEFDEPIFWEAVVSVDATQPVSITTIDEQAATLALAGSASDPHLTLQIGDEQLRLDCWPRRVASDSWAERREGLLERAGAMDMSEAEVDQFATALDEVQPKPLRIRAALIRARETIQQWYADLDKGVRERRPFGIAELRPDSIAKIRRHLRLDDDLNLAAKHLIEDRGLIVAIRRFGGLPISPPQSILEALEQIGGEELETFLENVEASTAPPWTQLFLADALLATQHMDAAKDRAKSWVDSALSDEARPLWDLYIALARFTASEGFSDKDWIELGARQQLAVCWSHANALVEILAAGGIIIENMLEMLSAHRLISPRLLVERLDKFGSDAANPHTMASERLLAHAGSPPLFRFLGIEEFQDWARASLRKLVVEDGPDGSTLPNISITQASLAPQNSLPSFLSAPSGEQFEAIYPGARGLFRDGIEDLVIALLDAESSGPKIPAGWTLMRQASADAPLPAKLATLAKERRKSLDLTFPGGELEVSRLQLLNFVALAAMNEWSDDDDLSRIDAAVSALGPRPEDEDASVFFEIAFWRSRMVEGDLERTKFLADELKRYGYHEPFRAPVIVAARHFARGLSGQQTEAFVDTIGELISTY